MWCAVSGRWFWLGNANFEIMHLPLAGKKEEGKGAFRSIFSAINYHVFGLKYQMTLSLILILIISL
jgi:hypothetical protein